MVHIYHLINILLRLSFFNSKTVQILFFSYDSLHKNVPILFLLHVNKKIIVLGNP